MVSALRISFYLPILHKILTWENEFCVWNQKHQFWKLPFSLKNQVLKLVWCLLTLLFFRWKVKCRRAEINFETKNSICFWNLKLTKTYHLRPSFWPMVNKFGFYLFNIGCFTRNRLKKLNFLTWNYTFFNWNVWFYNWT